MTRRDIQSRYDRLSGADVMNLVAERPGTPWHIGLIGVLDGAPLTTKTGDLRLAGIRDTLAEAVLRAPRLRQVVRRTRPGQGRPVWVEAAEVDLDRHLRVAPVPAPGDELTFLHRCEEVLVPVMDRARPLWDLTLLPGLADGQVGVVLRLHHALADGLAAVQLVQALFDGPSGSAVGTGPSALSPSGGALAVDAWSTRLAVARAALHSGPRVRGLAASVGALGSQLESLVRPREPFPRTSLTRPVGPTRRLALLRVPLERVHAVTHAHGASVNDAVLAAVAGGLRAVLESRGEPADLTLRASVPVSLRAGEKGGAVGNRVGVLMVPLPLEERDTVRRLERIAEATRTEKVKARRAGPLVVLTTTLGVRLALPLLRRQRLVSVFVTNVPGPSATLRLAGARLVRAYPAAPIAGNVTLGVGVLSYAGDLGLGLVADAEAWPDLPVFVDALRDSFGALVDAD